MGHFDNATITKQAFKREPKLWQLPLGTAGIIVILFFLAVIPMINTIYLDFEVIGSKKALLSQLVEKRTALEALNETELNQQLKAVNRVLPSTKPVIEVINSLSGTASQAGVVLQSYVFSPGEIATQAGEITEKEAAPGSLTTIKVESEINGRFDQALQYLNRLMKTAPLTFVVTADLEGTDDSLQPQTVTLVTDTYFALPVNELGPLEQPLPEISASAKTWLTSMVNYVNYGTDDPPVATAENRGNLFEF